MNAAPLVTASSAQEEPCLIALLGGPRSPKACALVDHLLERVVLPHRLAMGRTKQAGDKTQEKLTSAIGALLADLLNLQRRVSAEVARSGAHGMSPKDFPSKNRLGFGRDIFLQVTQGLVAAGLLSKVDGLPRWKVAIGDLSATSGRATTFRLTPAFFELAETFGIGSADTGIHWTLVAEGRGGAVGPAVVLREKRKMVAGRKLDAKDMPVDFADPSVITIESQLRRLNGYLKRQNIGGLAFFGLRRIFNNGDQPDFAWNKGGRYYSRDGQAYESWRAAARRELITINGEAVAEVDLRASHLTLLHALLREPFGAHPDPYDTTKWPRIVVKLWIAQALGSSNARPRQWSRRSKADYEAERPDQFLQDNFPIHEVGAFVKDRYPLLVGLSTYGITTLDLQFHEAEILRLAMEDLMLRQDIPVLPIHDALITPTSRVSEAEVALKQAFSDYVGVVTGHPSLVEPRVTYKKPLAS